MQLVAAGAVVTLLVAIGGSPLLRRWVGHSAVGPSPARDSVGLRPHRVIVLPPLNPGGDSVTQVASRIAADWITHQLQGTGLVEVVDPTTASRLLAEAGQGIPLGDETSWLPALARAAQAATVVWGSSYRQGDSIAFRLRLVDARDGTVRGALDPVLAPARDPTVALPALAERVAGALASMHDERLASLASSGSNPPTFAAYQEYLNGLDRYLASRRPEALESFRRTLQLDSTFALARFWSVYAIRSLGQPAAYDSAVRALAPLRNQLPAAERAVVDMFSRELVQDWEGALRAAREAARQAPHSTYPYDAAQYALWRLDRPAEAIRYLTELDPTRGWLKGWAGYWVVRLWAHHRAGDYRGELEAARVAQPLLRPHEVNVALGSELRALLGLGRLGEFQERFRASVDTLVPIPNSGLAWFYSKVAAELRTHGFEDLARRAFERCAEVLPGPSVRSQLFSVFCVYESGRWSEACAGIDSAVQTSRLGQYPLGLVQARRGICATQLGRQAKAREILEAIAAQRPPPAEWSVVAPEVVRLAYLLGQPDRAAGLLGEPTDYRGWLIRGLHENGHLASVDDPRVARMIWPAGGRSKGP